MYEILHNFSKTHEVVSVYSNLDNTFVHLTGHIIKVTRAC